MHPDSANYSQDSLTAAIVPQLGDLSGQEADDRVLSQSEQAQADPGDPGAYPGMGRWESLGIPTRTKATGSLPLMPHSLNLCRVTFLTPSATHLA